MNLLIWLDLLLLTLGLLAMSPGLWHVLRVRRLDRRFSLGRGLRTATTLLYSLGVAVLAVAGIDAGLAEWDEACRLRGTEDPIRKSMIAPDFILPSLDEDRPIQLSVFLGHKPVVLIFGNFY